MIWFAKTDRKTSPEPVTLGTRLTAQLVIVTGFTSDIRPQSRLDI